MHAPAGLAEQADAMVSNTIVRKDVWVQVPHPAQVSAVRSSIDACRASGRPRLSRALCAPPTPACLMQRTPPATAWQSRRSDAGDASTNAAASRADRNTCLRGAHNATVLIWIGLRTQSCSAGTWGDGHITRQRRRVFGLHIFNDARYTDLNMHVADLMRRVKPRSRPHTRRVPGCTVTTVSWKHWPCLFPQHGPGRKHERALSMTEWQWAIVTEHPADFLRGLFHSDGCRVNNWATRMVAGEKKRYDYRRWQFTNMSEDIMRWCCEALDLIDVPWRRSNHKTLSVSTRAGVTRWPAQLSAAGGTPGRLR